MVIEMEAEYIIVENEETHEQLAAITRDLITASDGVIVRVKYKEQGV